VLNGTRILIQLKGHAPGIPAPSVSVHNVLTTVIACVDGKGAGQVNLGSYCNPKVDALTQKIQTEVDTDKRNTMIREALEMHAQDVGHIPLHQQMLSWGVSKKITLAQRADNFMVFKWMTIAP